MQLPSEFKHFSAKNWDRRLIYSVTADFETNVRIVLEHLLYVFRCSIRILSISSSATNIFFSHSPKLKIKHLYVKSDDNKLTENLEKILKSVEAEGCVQIEGDGCISGGAEEVRRSGSVLYRDHDFSVFPTRLCVCSKGSMGDKKAFIKS